MDYQFQRQLVVTAYYAIRARLTRWGGLMAHSCDGVLGYMKWLMSLREHFKQKISAGLDFAAWDPSEGLGQTKKSPRLNVSFLLSSHPL